VPIEALLLGRGHIATAQRWGAALDAADAAVSALTLRTDEPSPAELLALSSRLKAVTSLYQREVAAALDVPLGFSSADGD
jgi:predicted lipoprotein